MQYWIILILVIIILAVAIPKVEESPNLQDIVCSEGHGCGTVGDALAAPLELMLGITVLFTILALIFPRRRGGP